MVDLAPLVPAAPVFRTHEAVREPIRAACAAHPGLAAFHDLGTSEAGRPLYGVVLGRGPRRASLVAGAHADEPVGPETLRTFVLQGLAQRERLAPLFDDWTFVIVPHVNPDGEARNRVWIERWPSLAASLRHRDREPPGRDVEFGYPDLRPENRAAAAFWRQHAPFAFHASLHGMHAAEGALLLIERHWTFRTQPLRDAFARAARAAGLPLHDHNRKGEKGFFQIEPGFSTTPEGEAMRHFFRAQGDDAMAARFRDSSMEYVRTLGGNPLCLVTELPLFHVEPDADHPPGVPTAYLAFKDRLARLEARLRAGASDEVVEEEAGASPLPLRTAMTLQLQTLAFGLDAARDG